MELKYNPKERTGKKGLPREMFMNWAGWFPHPELDRDIEPHPWPLTEEEQNALVALPATPPCVKFFIPNGISLAELRRHSVEYSTAPVLEAVQGHIVQALDAVATQDRKALLFQKPLDGIYAFIWRCARYHSGLASSIPTTAFWDLEDGISRLTGTRGGANEEVVSLLEKKAQELVEVTGGEKNTAVLRWARIAGRLD